MAWKLYKSELIVGSAFLVLLIAFFYKQAVISSEGNAGQESQAILYEIKETIALKKVWGDKKMIKKLNKIQKMISPSQVKWDRRGKKLKAVFSNLSSRELNQVVEKIMRLGVEIQKLSIKKLGASYSLEFKCKW
ncbi:MAG: hypothetical protein Q9M36_15825 [Sulfurovum sp.]|nr:hypothetical protein [Sulfurovum sp.]